MSDYEVNLVNDSMQEFYVRFFGPAESASLFLVPDYSSDPEPLHLSLYPSAVIRSVNWHHCLILAAPPRPP